MDNDKAVKHCSFAITWAPPVRKVKKSHRAKQKASVNRKISASGIIGRVVCLNVCKGYGLIHRDDKDIEILIHHTDIIKNNP